MTNPKRTKKEEIEEIEAHIRDADEEMEDDDSSEGEENSADDDGSSSEDEMVNTVVNIDFEAYPPDGSDFHGIRKLLVQIFRNGHVDVSDLTKHLIELNKLSIVLRQTDEEMNDEDDDDEEEDDVFGIGGLLPLGRDRDGVKSVRKFLLEQTGKDESARKRLSSTLSDGKVGFLISERFVNLPPRVALSVFESLHADWLKIPKSNIAFDFHHIILIAKQYQGSKETFFANGEEELFVDLADFHYSYEVPSSDADTAVGGKWKEDDEVLKQIRKVLIIDVKQFPKMIEVLKENV